MTVSTIGSIAEFDTNGVTTNYPFYFKFLANEDLVVTYVNPDGVSSTLTLGTNYTVNGAGNEQGGSIVTTTALAGPGQLIVSREMEAFQQTSLRNQGKFLAETHEDVFDKLTMLVQQGFAIFTRALTRPFGRDYFFAENRRIASVQDPVELQDAATKKWSLSTIADIIAGMTGNPNLASNVFYQGPDGLPYTVQDLSGPNGAKLVGRTGGQVNDLFVADDATKGAAIVPYKKTTLYGRFKNSAHVSDWGVLGADLVTVPDNEGAKLAQAVAEVAAGNGTLLFDNRNYLTDRTLIASGAFRSFRLQGAGVGNSQTAGTGGTTILTSGGYRAFRAEFNTFANENCRIEGLNFNNMAQNTSDYEAISIVRGSANGRYISGFIFKDVGITGFGAGISWQGMNTIDSGLNYFGTTIIDNVHVSDTGAGLALSNCSLNLLDIRSTVFHTCPQGGIRLLRDGAVGAGNGRGSSITAHISGKSHFENVAGMFRTQTTRTFGGTGTSAYLRSTIHMDGLLHEFCGSSIGPTSGDPFVLGVDTDIIVTGDVNYGPGYGEASVPLINPSNTITSSSPIMVIMNGGISKSPMMVNAPKIRRPVINTGSTNFTIVAPASANFALRSRLILGDGLLGIIESVHNGNSSGTKYTTSTTPQPSSGASGVTVSFSAGSAGNVIFCSVTNNSGTTIAIELQVDNYSHTTISTPSESF